MILLYFKFSKCLFSIYSVQGVLKRSRVISAFLVLSFGKDQEKLNSKLSERIWEEQEEFMKGHY